MQCSLVDHYLTNNEDLYKVAGICPTKMSDHDIIFASRKKFKKEKDKNPLRARKYKNLDEGDLFNDLESYNWDNI